MFGDLLGPCVGGRVEVWTKNILNRFIEGQTHFSNAYPTRFFIEEKIYSQGQNGSRRVQKGLQELCW